MPFLKMLLSEIKSTLRDKDIIVILLGGPLFLTLLFGGVYANSYVDDIPMAVLDEDNSSLSRMLVQQFDESDRFELESYASSKEELKKMLDSGRVHMGLYIPHGFSEDVGSLRSPDVLILVDGTNMVIGNNSYAAAASIVQTIAAGTQIKLLEAKGMAPVTAKNIALAFNIGERILYDPRMTYMNYLLPGFVAVFLQQVMLSGVGLSVIKEGSGIAYGNTFGKVAAKITACAFFGLISTFASVGAARIIFNIPVRGNLFSVLLLSTVFVFAVSCPAVILASLLKNELKFYQISFMLSLPTFVGCGYVWPEEQMPVGLALAIKSFWPLINFARPFAELIVKGVPLSAVGADLIQLLVYVLFWMPVSILILKRSYTNTPLGTKG